MEHERNTQCDHQQGRESQEKAAVDQVEVKERGLFDTLLGRNKSEEDQVKKQEEALVTGMDNVKVSEPQKHEVNKDEHHGVGEKKKKSLLAKLHRTGSSSSSSSDDEEEEVIDDNGEVVKRKKKKCLKEKIKEKLPGHKDDHDVEEGEHKPHAPAPPVPTHVVHQEEAEEHKQPYVATPAPVVVQKVQETTPEKGLLDKIKEKLPGGHKKPEVDAAAPPLTATEDVSSPDGKEKKQGLLGKIMDRIPGYNKSPAEEEHKPATATGEHEKTSS